MTCLCIRSGKIKWPVHRIWRATVDDLRKLLANYVFSLQNLQLTSSYNRLRVSSSCGSQLAIILPQIKNIRTSDTEISHPINDESLMHSLGRLSASHLNGSKFWKSQGVHLWHRSHLDFTRMRNRWQRWLQLLGHRRRVMRPWLWLLLLRRHQLCGWMLVIRNLGWLRRSVCRLPNRWCRWWCQDRMPRYAIHVIRHTIYVHIYCPFIWNPFLIKWRWPTYSDNNLVFKPQGTLHAAVPMSLPVKSLKLTARANSLVPIRMTLGRSNAETVMTRRRARWSVAIMERVQAPSMWAVVHPLPIPPRTLSPILRSCSVMRANPVKTPISTSLPWSAKMMERIRKTATWMCPVVAPNRASNPLSIPHMVRVWRAVQWKLVTSPPSRWPIPIPHLYSLAVVCAMYLCAYMGECHTSWHDVSMYKWHVVARYMAMYVWHVVPRYDNVLKHVVHWKSFKSEWTCKLVPIIQQSVLYDTVTGDTSFTIEFVIQCIQLNNLAKWLKYILRSLTAISMTKMK